MDCAAWGEISFLLEKERFEVTFLDQIESQKFCNSENRLVKLSQAEKDEISAAWKRWRDSPFNPYIDGRNALQLYNQKNADGANLVAVQSKYGVWLIHPINANAGLLPDDPRIIRR